MKGVVRPQARPTRRKARVWRRGEVLVEVEGGDGEGGVRGVVMVSGKRGDRGCGLCGWCEL